MASTTVSGNVYHVGVTEEISSTFKKRILVLEDLSSPDYPQYLKVEVKQDKVTLLDTLKLGQTVTAHININGRKYTDKQGVEQYFVSLDAWKLDIQAEGTAPQYTPPIDINTPASEIDDLPF